MKFIRSTLLPLVAVSSTLLILWYVHRPVQVVQSNMPQVQQEAKRGDYRLIDAETLWKQYQSNRDKIRMVDTRQQWEHFAGHIKGSSNFPLEPTWWARWQKKGELKAFLGADKEKIIVFY